MKASLGAFVFCVLSLNITDANLVIVKQGNSKYVVFGEAFTALCRGSNAKNATWFYENKTISEGVVSSQSNEELKLEIEMVNFANQGRYSCRLGEMEDSVTLYVYKKPVFLNVNESQTITAGEVGRITCEIDALNKTFYEWKKDRVTVIESERIRIEQGKYLEIRNVNRNDQGTYECLATIVENSDVTNKEIEVTVTMDEAVTEESSTNFTLSTVSSTQFELRTNLGYSVQPGNSSQVHTVFYSILLSVVFTLMMSG